MVTGKLPKCMKKKHCKKPRIKEENTQKKQKMKEYTFCTNRVRVLEPGFFEPRCHLANQPTFVSVLSANATINA